MSNNDDFNDGVATGALLTIIGGLAIYGTYKIIQNLTASPEEKLLRQYAKDIRQLESADYEVAEDNNESA